MGLTAGGFLGDCWGGEAAGCRVQYEFGHVMGWSRLLQSEKNALEVQSTVFFGYNADTCQNSTGSSGGVGSSTEVCQLAMASLTSHELEIYHYV